MTLPPEVVVIVCNSLCKSSLNALTRTCKKMNDIVAPILYRSVILRAPIYWSRLPSFESLVSSSARNFDLVQQVHIVTQVTKDQQSAQSVQSDGSTECEGSAESDKSAEDDESSESDESGEDDESSESDESGEDDESSKSDETSESDYDHIRVHPADFASKAINVLIRILIARLPKQRLEVFRFALPESEANLC